jgi:hypothetical protein
MVHMGSPTLLAPCQHAISDQPFVRGETKINYGKRIAIGRGRRAPSLAPGAVAARRGSK